MSGERIPGSLIGGASKVFVSLAFAGIADYGMFDMYSQGHLEAIPALLGVVLATGVGITGAASGVAAMRGPTI